MSIDANDGDRRAQIDARIAAEYDLTEREIAALRYVVRDELHNRDASRRPYAGRRRDLLTALGAGALVGGLGGVGGGALVEGATARPTPAPSPPAAGDSPSTDVTAETVDAVQVVSDSRSADYVVYRDATGTYHATGNHRYANVTGDDFATVLNAAIQNLPYGENNGSASGGTILVKNGRYPVTTPILVDRSVHLLGSGIKSTVLRQADGANLPQLLEIHRAKRTPIASVLDMKLDSNAANNERGDTVTHDTITDVTFQRVWFGGGPDGGYRCAHPPNDTYNVRFYSCLWEGYRDGTAVEFDQHGGNINRIYLADCLFVNNHLDVKLRGAVDAVYITSCHVHTLDVGHAVKQSIFVTNSPYLDVTGAALKVIRNGMQYPSQAVTVLSGGTATAWTDVDISNVALYTGFANYALIEIDATGDGTAGKAQVRLRERGYTGTHHAVYSFDGSETWHHQAGPFWVPLDRGQVFQYAASGHVARVALRQVGAFV